MALTQTFREPFRGAKRRAIGTQLDPSEPAGGCESNALFGLAIE